MNRQSIAVLLERRRVALMIDKVELAARSGISRAMLHRFERGQSDLSVEHLIALASALGLRLDLVPEQPLTKAHRTEKTRSQKRFLAAHPDVATRGFGGSVIIGQAHVPTIGGEEW